MDIVSVLVRTFFFYFFILFSYRIMGKREIGQLSITDLSISILIAELVAISIENHDDNILLTILPIVLLVVLEIVLSLLQLRINKTHEVMDGDPSVIIDKGKLNIKEMIKQRYSINDLLLAIREKNIKSIDEIDYAVLETNGKLSIFKKGILKKHKEHPLPLIIDSEINLEVLKSIDKSKKWLLKELEVSNVSLDDILYAFYKKNKIYVVKK